MGVWGLSAVGGWVCVSVWGGTKTKGGPTPMHIKSTNSHKINHHLQKYICTNTTEFETLHILLDGGPHFRGRNEITHNICVLPQDDLL